MTGQRPDTISRPGCICPFCRKKPFHKDRRSARSIRINTAGKALLALGSWALSTAICSIRNMIVPGFADGGHDHIAFILPNDAESRAQI